MVAPIAWKKVWAAKSLPWSFLSGTRALLKAACAGRTMPPPKPASIQPVQKNTSADCLKTALKPARSKPITATPMPRNHEMKGPKFVRSHEEMAEPQMMAVGLNTPDREDTACVRPSTENWKPPVMFTAPTEAMLTTAPSSKLLSRKGSRATSRKDATTSDTAFRMKLSPSPPLARKALPFLASSQLSSLAVASLSCRLIMGSPSPALQPNVSRSRKQEAMTEKTPTPAMMPQTSWYCVSSKARM
mmetsp:Transcript_84551/g.262560  ORF Transcript_84551/g.262560 Transcript_84551/m.262560 type:complete len:245 (-) Transcript_84551:526-1260(-)